VAAPNWKSSKVTIPRGDARSYPLPVVFLRPELCTRVWSRLTTTNDRPRCEIWRCAQDRSKDWAYAPRYFWGSAWF